MRVPARRALLLLSLASPLALAGASAHGVEITGTGQGPVALAPGASNAHELSGLAYPSFGGDAFLAIGDSGATVYALDVPVDTSTGAILSANVDAAQPLAAGTDLEGIVALPGGALLTSDEVGPAIREHDFDGSLIASVSVPAIYANARTNYSLESLALQLASEGPGDVLWTANEEALTVDGGLSTNVSGSVVRLQRFDATFSPEVQFAYETDPFPGGAFAGLERSGVSDLLALPTGELLVLERSFSNQGFRTRIYEVDFAGATDTTALASLASDPYVPVDKILRYETSGGFSYNYEGLAIGRELDAGDWSLLLVSDDGGGSTAQALLALRIHSLPEPGGMPGLAWGSLAVAWLAGRVRHPAHPPLR